MQIKKEQAVQVCEALGFGDAANWSTDKLQQRLCSLHEVVNEDQTIGDQELDNLLDDLIYCGKALSETIDVIESAAPEPVVIAVATAEVPVEEQKPVRAFRRLRKHVEEIQTANEEKKKGRRKKKVYKPRTPKPPYLVRTSTKGRYFIAGVLFRELGMDEGVTEQILKSMAAEFTGTKRNRKADLAALKNAWQVLNGFINGEPWQDYLSSNLSLRIIKKDEWDETE